jgi:hypothetical protein
MGTLASLAPQTFCASTSFKKSFNGQKLVNKSSIPVSRRQQPVMTRSAADAPETKSGEKWSQSARQMICGACAALTLAGAALPSLAGNVRLPPLSQDPARCERAYVGNTIGQANGVSDKVLDLRNCSYANEKEQLKGKVLASALLVGANFDNADLSESIMTKAYAAGASFKGTDFTSAVVDRVAFEGADLRGAIFRNTVLSGATYVGANLEGATFEDALLGYIDVQNLCKNTTLGEDAKVEIGCK